MENASHYIPSEIGAYKICEPIGFGTFSCVYKGIHKLTESFVSIKIVQKNELSDTNDRKMIEDELNILKKLDCPFVCAFFDYLEDENNIYFVMEYVSGGDLLNEINKKHCLSEKAAHKIFCQLISALDYLHNVMHVIHRDIKNENILLDSHGNIRIVDFGLSKGFSPINRFRNSICGSPAYASPEMIMNMPYTVSTDIWSAGVVLFTLVTGKLPFDDVSDIKLMKKIVYTTPHFPDNISQDLRALLSRLLTKDWKSRITIQEIKDHPWVVRYRKSMPLEFDFGNKASIGNFCRLRIDSSTSKSLSNLGYNIDNLFANLLTGVINETTAAYKILIRKKVSVYVDRWQRVKLPKSMTSFPKAAMSASHISKVLNEEKRKKKSTLVHSVSSHTNLLTSQKISRRSDLPKLTFPELDE